MLLLSDILVITLHYNMHNTCMYLAMYYAYVCISRTYVYVLCMNLVAITHNVCMQVLHNHANLVHDPRRDRTQHVYLHNPRRD